MNEGGASDLGRLRLLAALRIGWAVLWLLALGVWANFLWEVRDMPDAAWVPLSFGHFFLGKPAALYASFIWGASAVSAVLVGLGRFTRTASAVAFASGTLLGAMILGWGKLGHTTQPLLLFVLIFSFSPWGAVWSLDRRASPHRALPPVSDSVYQVWMLVTGLMYFASGLLKAYRGVFTGSGHLSDFIVRQNLRYAEWYGVPTPDWARALADWVVAHPAFADLAGWGALALELGIVVGALGPRFRVLGCGLILVLHGGISVLSPLRFFPQPMLALLVALATLVLLRRPAAAPSSRLARWFPGPGKGFRALDDPGLEPFFAHAAALTALLGLNFVLRGDQLVPYDKATGWAVPLQLYVFSSAWFMALIGLAGVALCSAAVLGLARTAGRLARAPRPDTSQRTLLYDQDCGFCQEWVDWASQRNPVGVLFRPCQGAEALRLRADITMEECSHAAFLVREQPDGSLSRQRGAGAINGVMARLSGPRTAIWRLLSSLYGLQGVRQLQDLGYGWVAANRHRMGETACKLPDAPPQ